MAGQPTGPIGGNGIGSHLLKGPLQRGRLPAPALQGPCQQPGVACGGGWHRVGRSAAQLGGHQHHLPALMDQGAKLAEGRRHRLRQGLLRGGSQQLQGGAAGRPPIFLHAVDQHAVEIKDEQRCRNQGHSRSFKTGPLGFEPRNGGTKTRCLTAWRRPNERIFRWAVHWGTTCGDSWHRFAPVPSQ